MVSETVLLFGVCGVVAWWVYVKIPSIDIDEREKYRQEYTVAREMNVSFTWKWETHSQIYSIPKIEKWDMIHEGGCGYVWTHWSLHLHPHGGPLDSFSSYYHLHVSPLIFLN